LRTLLKKLTNPSKNLPVKKLAVIYFQHQNCAQAGRNIFLDGNAFMGMA
jgi:hypothetical protein